MFSQSAQMAIQGLWAKPWLRDVSGLMKPNAPPYSVDDGRDDGEVLYWGLPANGFTRPGKSARSASDFGDGGVHRASAFDGLRVDSPADVADDRLRAFATAGILPYAGLSQIFPKP